LPLSDNWRIWHWVRVRYSDTHTACPFAAATMRERGVASIRLTFEPPVETASHTRPSGLHVGSV